MSTAPVSGAGTQTSNIQPLRREIAELRAEMGVLREAIGALKRQVVAPGPLPPALARYIEGAAAHPAIGQIYRWEADGITHVLTALTSDATDDEYAVYGLQGAIKAEHRDERVLFETINARDLAEARLDDFLGPQARLAYSREG